MAKAFQKSGSVADIMKKASDKSLSANTDVIKEIKLDRIIENELNKFSMNEDIEFEFLKESIKRTGVMQPVILKRNEDDTYTIIAGHRRIRASKAVERKTVPAIVKDYNDENDILDLVETNLTTRKLTVDDILSSIDILENLLKNSDTKISGKISEYIGKMLNMSGKQVERYKALSNLIPELKEKVDNKEIGISSVTGIASLPKEKQETALKEIKKTEEETGKPVSREQAKEIKKDIESVDNLIPELKEKVENEEIDLKSGAELSTLPVEKQKEADEIIETTKKETGKPVTIETTKEIKRVIENSSDEAESKADVKASDDIEVETSEKQDETSSIEAKSKIKLDERKAKAMRKYFDEFTTEYLTTNNVEKYTKNLKEFRDYLDKELKKLEN